MEIMRVIHLFDQIILNGKSHYSLFITLYLLHPLPITCNPIEQTQTTQ